MVFSSSHWFAVFITSL